MSSGGRKGPRHRRWRIRRAAHRDQPSSAADGDRSERLAKLEARLAHIEQMVEGLQDSVHRESQRHDELIVEIQAQLRPGAIRAALADDARQRGL